MCSNRAANSSSSRTIFVFFFCGGCFCRLNRGGGGGIVVVVVVFIVAFFFFSSLKSSSLSSSSSFGRDRKDISLETIFTETRERGVFVCTSFLLFLSRGSKVCPVPWTRSWWMRGPSSQEERFFHQPCQPPPKKNFLEETTFFSLVSSHLLPFLLRNFSIHTRVYKTTTRRREFPHRFHLEQL